MESIDTSHIDELVDEVMEVKPWRGFCYGILYPFRRLPLFFYVLLPCLVMRLPVMITLPVCVVSLFLDLKIAPKFSRDLPPNLRSFIKTLCANKIVEPSILSIVSKNKSKNCSVAGLILFFYCALAQVVMLHFHEIINETAKDGFGIIPFLLLSLHIMPFLFFCITYFFSQTYFYPVSEFPSHKNYPGINVLEHDRFDPEYILSLSGPAYGDSSKFIILIVVTPLYFLSLLIFLLLDLKDIIINVDFAGSIYLSFIVWTYFSVLVSNASSTWKAVSIIDYQMNHSKDQRGPN